MELLVYKASAGSGKTFTLAVEYIKHLIRNPYAYRQILAVTFTNKATAEMKERILTQLYGIWKGDPKSAPYLNSICEKLEAEAKAYREEGTNDTASPKQFTIDEIRHRAGEALQYMLHDYSRFRVETIDSFFQSVMRNLGRELELNPNLNIELNNTEVLSDAVDSMIEKLTPDSPVLAWLLEYIDERIADDKRWNVSGEVKQFGRNIFDESYIERGELLRRKLQAPETIRLYRDALRSMEQEALNEMKRLQERFEKVLEDNVLSEDDLSNKSKGISSYFRKIGNGRLTDKEVKNATLQKHLDSAENWASKSHKRRSEIVRLTENTLLPLLQEAERIRTARNCTINSCRLSLQHLNKLQLLNHIDEEVRTLNREHNRFLLSDTNALLHRLMREGDSSFVFEKIGAQIRTVMIDEFQDTSRMQWDNFRLLLLEGLSQGADSLIVGDVKQSIYRWRNGDWGILNGLRDAHPATFDAHSPLANASSTLPANAAPLLPVPIRVKTLKVNRRSESRVIHFNNAVFRSAVDYLNSMHLSELNEACLPLLDAYADVEQQSPKKEEHGYVKATFLEPDDEHDYTQVTLMALADEVKRLLDEGVRAADIAILVRKNKNIPAIADYFDRELQLPVVSDEAFRLDASEAVCRLIDALRWLTNPEDKVAEASFMPPQGVTSTQQDAARPPLSAFNLQHLRTLPLYELMEELYRLLDLQRVKGQEGYLFAFFDAVTEYLGKNSSEPGAFLRHWDEVLCGKTIPSGAVEGIRIYSIHKSKGLEFHTVLIPFCDWKLENETNSQLVWCAPTVAPYNAIDLVPVNYSPLMAESVYRSDYLHERLQLWVDNLNLLYVAFTRAGRNLILWSRKGQRGTMAELLSHVLPKVALEAGIGTWDEEEGRFESGEREAPEAGRPSPALPPSTDDHPSANRLSVRPLPLPVSMVSRKPEVDFRQSNRSADFIAGVDEEHSWRRFVNRGNLLHELFSAIRTREDADEAIERLLFEGIIESREQEEEVRSLIARALALPQVQEWYDGTWQLFNECDIIWTGEDGRLLNRRPDRVMMRGRDIVVVDFKFGQPRNSYRRQVQGYIRLLRRMGYTDRRITGFLWYVEQGEVEQVSE